MFSSFAPPRLKMSSAVKITVDGNSIAQGAYGSGLNSARWYNVMRTLSPASLAASLANVAVSGQSWQNMDGVPTSLIPGATATDVDGSFDSTKTNVLMLWETTNSICNEGRSLSRTIGDTISYLKNRFALHPDWKPIIIGTIPRQNGGAISSVYGGNVPAMNTVLEQYDAWMAGNWKAIGCKGFVSMRPPGGPYSFTDYSETGFSAASAYYNESTGARTHQTDLGQAFSAGVINAALMRLLR